jgi:hypothetical protein
MAPHQPNASCLAVRVYKQALLKVLPKVLQLYPQQLQLYH